MRLRGAEEDHAGGVGGGDVGVRDHGGGRGDAARHGEDGGARGGVAVHGDGGARRRDALRPLGGQHLRDSG